MGYYRQALRFRGSLEIDGGVQSNTCRREDVAPNAARDGRVRWACPEVTPVYTVLLEITRATCGSLISRDAEVDAQCLRCWKHVGVSLVARGRGSLIVIGGIGSDGMSCASVEMLPPEGAGFVSLPPLSGGGIRCASVLPLEESSSAH